MLAHSWLQGFLSHSFTSEHKKEKISLFFQATIDLFPSRHFGCCGRKSPGVADDVYDGCVPSLVLSTALVSEEPNGTVISYTCSFSTLLPRNVCWEKGPS